MEDSFDHLFSFNEKLNRMLKPYQSTFEMIERINKITQPYNSISNKINQLTNSYQISKKVADIQLSAINSAQLIGTSQDLNKLIYPNLSYWEAFNDKISNSILSESIFEKILSLDKSIQAYKNIDHLLSKDKSLKNIIQNSIEIDIENNKSEKLKIESVIEEILEDANNVIENAEKSTEHAFILLNNFLKKLFNSRNVRSFTRDFIMDLVITILITIATQSLNEQSNITNQEVIINNTTNNVTINQCDWYISEEEKILRTYPRGNSKIIDTIPLGTEITVIKQNRVWSLISYKEENGSYVIGWSTTPRINN